MSLLAIFKRTIGQNDFGMLYESLFSLGIITIVADLK